jgi:beta-mannanase
MKKITRFLCAFLVCTLLVGAVPALAAQPSGYWPYFTAYTDAVNSGKVSDILKTGDAMLAFYSKFEMNQSIAEMSYNIYHYRYANHIYEDMGDYDAAIDNLQKLYDCCVYLDSCGKDYSDMELICTTLISKLDPMTEVYALTTDLSDYPVYGVTGEPSSGTYYGRIVSDYSQNYDDVASEAIASFYVQIEGESADQFAYKIKNYDGSQVIHIAYNMTNEAETAKNIIAGKCDDGIKATLEYLSTLKSPVLLRIGAEMNLWQMDATLYKNAYIYIAKLARKMAPNVALVFSVNYVSYWNGDMSDYYPGDQYVDWVGVSLYVNTYASSSSRGQDAYFGRGDFADCVLSIKETVEKFGDKKPIIISESGVNYVGSTANQESLAAAQMNKLYSTINMVYPQVKAIIYFDRNSPSSSNNYTISENAKVSSAYKTATSSNLSLVSTLGSSSQGVYMPLTDSFSEKTDTLHLAAYGMTIGNTMKVTYKLDNKTLSSNSTVPYYCNVSASSISTGTHTLTVSFSDGNGYSKTKTYKLSKLMDGTITTSKSVELPSNWAISEVSEAIDAGLVSESFQSSYTSKITRADFCKLVVNLVELKTGMDIKSYLSINGYTVNPNAFKDTTDSTILAANALGIVNGKSGGIFDPNASITRQEAAKMLTVAAEVLGLDTTSSGTTTFADKDKFGSWASDYIAFVSSTNDKTTGKAIMGGVDGNKFDPLGTYSREQAYITMLRLYRAL